MAGRPRSHGGRCRSYTGARAEYDEEFAEEERQLKFLGIIVVLLCLAALWFYGLKHVIIEPQAPAIPFTASCGVGCTINGSTQSNSGTTTLCTANSSNVTECTNPNAGGVLSLTAGNNTAVYCVDMDEALKAKDKEIADLRRQIKDLQRRSVN
jgi:hypothetical protein